MAVIEVECNTFPEAINTISLAMSSIVDSLSAINTEFSNMGTSWTGKRYDELVTMYNGFHDKTDIVVKEGYAICKSLETIANYYSKVVLNNNVITDDAKISDEYEFEVLSFEPTANGGLKFNAENVKKNQENIDSYLDNIVTKAGEISSAFKGITWSSEANTNFGRRVSDFKKASNDWINYVKKKVDKKINSAITDLGNTEDTNADI